MRVKKRFQGMSPHRYKDNPLEKAFAVAWQEANDESIPGRGHPTLAYLMDREGRGTPQPPLTDRDWLIACTVVQWLGSPVGQGFLKHVLAKSAAKQVREDIQDAVPAKYPVP